MGSSHHLQISTIVSLLLYSNPRSVLDIGAGYGKYGVLSREYLGKAGKDKNFRLEAIEGHRDNVTDLHKAVYDKIHIGDATKLINKVGKGFDTVLLIDVLEHFNKDEGTELIQNILGNNKTILISTPKYVGHQHSPENPFQEHKSQWSRSELASFGKAFFASDAISHVVFAGDQNMVDKTAKKYRYNQTRYRLGSIPVINFLYRKLFWERDNSILRD